jgi:hypothetical protein
LKKKTSFVTVRGGPVKINGKLETLIQNPVCYSLSDSRETRTVLEEAQIKPEMELFQDTAKLRGSL